MARGSFWNNIQDSCSQCYTQNHWGRTVSGLGGPGKGQCVDPSTLSSRDRAPTGCFLLDMAGVGISHWRRSGPVFAFCIIKSVGLEPVMGTLGNALRSVGCHLSQNGSLTFGRKSQQGLNTGHFSTMLMQCVWCGYSREWRSPLTLND